MIWRVLLSSVRESNDDLFKSPSRNRSLFRRDKDEVLVNQRTRTVFNRRTFYFEWIDADVSLFNLSLTFYCTISRRQLILTRSPADLWRKVCGLDLEAREFPMASADVCGGARKNVAMAS